MQKYLTSIFALLFTASLFAQHEPIQPFEELGIKVKVLTLSNGKYQESFPNDTIFRFGSVMFNRVTGEVVTVIENDTLYGEYNLKAEVVSRWLSPDPLAAKNPNWSPYTAMNDNPILYVDPDGMDAIVSIKGNTITVSTTIYIYGDGATAAVAGQYKTDIDAKWAKQSSGANWTYTDSETGSTYDVVFDIKVDLYEGKAQNAPMIIPESWNPSNTDNFIEVSNSTTRSHVTLGDEGEWRGQGRGGASLAADDPAPHELGHLLGLKDRYSDSGGTDPGWSGNIMGDSATGNVDQRNINGVVGDSVKDLNKAVKNGFNSTTNEYKTKIDVAFPSN